MATDNGNAPKDKKLEKLLEITKRRTKEAVDAAEQKPVDPRQMWLPGFDLGAMPNHINRSSLFAPVARGARKFHRETVLVTRSDCLIEYTGEQLDEADGDIIMALIFYARNQPLGTPVKLISAELLRMMGRATGKQNYEWLKRRMRALTVATMYVEARKPDGTTKYKVGRSSVFHILQSIDCEEDDLAYYYMVDPRWVQLFGNREYSIIDWDKRLQIGRGQDMAKTLQRLVATSSNKVQQYALDWLKEKMQYNSPIRKFKEALETAMRELERLEIIENGRIEENTKGKLQAVWTKIGGTE